MCGAFHRSTITDDRILFHDNEEGISQYFVRDLSCNALIGPVPFFKMSGYRFLLCCCTTRECQFIMLSCVCIDFFQPFDKSVLFFFWCTVFDHPDNKGRNTCGFCSGSIRRRDNRFRQFSDQFAVSILLQFVQCRRAVKAAKSDTGPGGSTGSGEQQQTTDGFSSVHFLRLNCSIHS